MDKRHFLKIMGLGALALSGLAPACTKLQLRAKTGKPLPDNWMWIGHPKTGLSDDDWKRQFGKLREAGIEAVLPEVYNGTDALFDHPTFPVRERLLERLIPLAHEAGLQIHAWMWTMPCNNEEIIRKHPDWFAVNGLNEPAHLKPAYVGYYKFLCPCHPEVQDFVQGNVEALAKIKDLDGVHLDYVRLPDVILAEALQPNYNIVQDREYPQYDYSYSEYCRKQFKEKTGIDPLSLPDPSANAKWRQFRCDSVTNLVNGRLAPAARRYGKTISAAVFPNWESVRQQWHKWDLDAFLPMLYHNFYNADLNWIKQQVEAARGRLMDIKPVYSGLFLPSLTPEDLKKAAQLSLRGGAAGIAFFSMEAFSDAHAAAVKGILK